MPFVYSTATAGIRYAGYFPLLNENDPISRINTETSVEIKGGHLCAVLPEMNYQAYTPRGVCTEVTADQLKFLMNHVNFLEDLKNGFMSYDDLELKPEIKIKDMAERDNSSPLVPKDFEDFQENSEDGSKIFRGKPRR